MKVFIGWAGATSREIASILKSWLPIMNPHIETFVSDDIERGAAWQVSLSQMIAACDCALFCVTEDNINSPWLHYEAGAVSGQGKFVIPVLFDTSARFFGPLSQFQSLTLKKDDMRRLAYELNAHCGQDAVSPEELDAQFEGIYPTIEKMLAEARKSRESDEFERAREYLKQAWLMRQQLKASQADEWVQVKAPRADEWIQVKAPQADEGDLKQDFETLNNKLDAILSQLSKVSSGNIGGKAE